MPSFERVVFSVSQANLYIKNIFEKDEIISSVTIKGEISNFKLHTSGHLYMSLKDEGAVLRAVMFKTSASKLNFTPQNGLKVLASGRISVYERDGQYQLYIESMSLDGVGALHVAFEELKKRLNERGFFDPKHKKPLPKYPKTVGIATAPTGAAIRDMLNILKRRFPCSNVVLYPVLVQGETASSSIVMAIEYFNKEKNVDVLIIGRGGGSIEDLWAFNEEKVANAIFDSHIPIVSAVGHEIDFTISDFVADVRAPTPSAAAEIIVPSQIELKNQINNFYGRILFSSKKSLEIKQDKIKQMLRNIILRSPLNKINEKRLYLDSLTKIILSFIKNFLEKLKKRMQVAKSKLSAMDPYNVLHRGYSILQNSTGSILKTVEDIQVNENINVMMVDGKALCEVKELYKKVDKNE